LPPAAKFKTFCRTCGPAPIVASLILSLTAYFRAVCDCVYGSSGPELFASRFSPDWIKPQTGRFNKSPHTVHAPAIRSKSAGRGRSTSIQSDRRNFGRKSDPIRGRTPYAWFKWRVIILSAYRRELAPSASGGSPCGVRGVMYIGTEGRRGREKERLGDRESFRSFRLYTFRSPGLPVPPLFRLHLFHP
jgi:hypothetical protein